MKYIKDIIDKKIYFEEIVQEKSATEGFIWRVVCKDENGNLSKGNASAFFQPCSCSDHALFQSEPPKSTSVEISKEEFEKLWKESKQKKKSIRTE